MGPFGEDIFGRWHPGLVLAYFACVIGTTMLVASPVFAGISLAGALVAALANRGRAAVLGAVAALALAVFVAAVNPLFNTEGDTVLFSIGGRPYTAEALMFGAVLGMQLAAALLWFAVAGRALPAEKITYLFGGIAPALACVLTLIVRLVPAYARRTRTVMEVRDANGCGPATAYGVMEKARAGATVLTTVMAWSLEQGVTTADSLAARGFGGGPRTAWGRYRLGLGGVVAAIAVAVLMVVVIAGLGAGAGWVQFLPRFALPEAGLLVTSAWAAWGVLLVAPTLVGKGEEALWRYSLSIR